MSELALQIIRENIEKHERGEDATILDLGNCGLTEVPSEALECVWVEELILSSEWGDYDFENDKVNQIESQNKGKSNKITFLPPNLSRLGMLKKLVIASTLVVDFIPLSGLTNLQILESDNTKVCDLSPLVGLTNLRLLCCNNSQIANLSPLSELTNLQILEFSKTQVDDLTPLAGLTNLQILNCVETKVTNLTPLLGLTNLQVLAFSETLVTNLAPLARLTNLQMLSFSKTKISDLSQLAGLTNLQKLDCSQTQVADLMPLTGLTNLQELYCPETQVDNLTPLSGLTNLQKIYCWGTQVADLIPLKGLANLQSLSFEETLVTDLWPLADLPNLKRLYCAFIPITDLSPILFLIRKGVPVKWQNWWEANQEDNQIDEKLVILVKNCPLTNPPVEVVKQGNEAILRYFKEKKRLETAHGAQPANIKVREAKVLLVGQGKSGKTSLRYKLENPDALMPAPGDTTRGIEITRLDEKMPHTGEPLRLNLWDFGGQDVQHYAHQFFLTGSSLYALVTNERIQDSVHLPYWLNIIEMLGKKSPVILIQNKDGGHCQALKDEASIRARFGNVHNRVFQSDFSQAVTEEEFADLRKQIIEMASKLPHIEREYLSSFSDLRQKLEAESDRETHYLVWGDYLKLMPELGADLMRDYANALTFLGVCQYFPDDAMLRKYVFLRPKWLIDALFELLLHPSLDGTRGLFSESDTLEIWKGSEYDQMHDLLVRMMKQFELCYRVDGDEEKFIVPQRLPGENKSYGWDSKDNTPVQYRYKFMPKGILTRLICRLHKRIENDTNLGQRVWNDAVIFTLSNGKGRVFAREVYSENTIELRAVGEKHDEMLNQVIQTMDDINRDIAEKYDNLQWGKMVPCPCADCALAETPGFHEYEALLKRIEKGKSTSECKKSGEDVPIDEIFGKSGLKKPVRRREEMGRFGGKPGKSEAVTSSHGLTTPRPVPLKIFISYSKHDREGFLIPMTRYLKPLMRGGLLETWDDRQILPGEEWDEKIRNKIEEADVIFLLVSDNSLDTEYIWNVEIEAAMRRHETGTARVIPIILSKCLWTEKDHADEYIFPPAKLNALPAKGKPIDEWDRENHAWDAVAEGVKAILKEMRV